MLDSATRSAVARGNLKYRIAVAMTGFAGYGLRRRRLTNGNAPWPGALLLGDQDVVEAGEPKQPGHRAAALGKDECAAGCFVRVVSREQGVQAVRIAEAQRGEVENYDGVVIGG